MRFFRFGLGDYSAILQLQQRLHDRRVTDEIPDTWLFGEHPAVVTQGVRADASDLLFDQAQVAGAVPVVKIDRGGMTTLHSPGQLILYPIVKLAAGSVAAGKFSRALQSAIQAWVQERFGVRAETESGHPGLYVEGRKLMSIGISVRNGVSMHGIALNLSNDLRLWKSIVACGEPERDQTSIRELTGEATEVALEDNSLAEFVQRAWQYETMESERLTLSDLDAGN